MLQTFIAFSVAVGAVTLAEMGDKTQLLAMAFAAKYKASKVMFGVFIATVLNHACAVALGSFIARYHAIDLWIQIIASISFIFFGLWTIRGDHLEGEENRKTRFGAVMTVAIAFFIAELGDKTQLATIALAAKFPQNPVGILAGSTTGMLIADGVGIIVSVVMCRRIPERTIKLVSAAVFIIFGFIGTWRVADQRLDLDHKLIAGILVVMIIITASAAWYLIKKNKMVENGDKFCKPGEG